MNSATEARRFLLAAYAAALASVDGRSRVRQFLAARPSTPYRVIAIGKAAVAMATGAFDVLGEQAGSLIITKHGYGDERLTRRATFMEAGHPAPDAGSLRAGEMLLRYIAGSAADQEFLFLLSGGASALVEVLPEGVTLEDLARANQWLLGAGLDITSINRVRKRLSCIKQGRLARMLQGRRALCLILSDVPNDDPAVMGSGPLVPDREPDALPPLPGWLADLVDRAPSPPATDDICFSQVETCILASNRDARQAAAEAARRAGEAVFLCDQLLDGDVADAAVRIVSALSAGGSGMYVWGGETTVRLPPVPGRGGRCQALALHLARFIAERDDLFILAAGTDGSDGPGEDAGALVDGGSAARGLEGGFVLEDALARADAGVFLEASGDLVTTGPTGTNVMDLVLALKQTPRNKTL